MYRRLVLLWLLLATGLTWVYAHNLPAVPAPLGRLAAVTPPGWLTNGGSVGLVLAALIPNLVPLVVGAALAWGAALSPGRRTPPWEAALHGLAAAAMAVYTAAWLYGRSYAAAAAATLLAAQIGRPPWLVLLASQAPHGLVEAAGVGLVLSAPLFWLLRAPQVRDFGRATFESWAEIRRLLWPAVGCLAVGAVIEVFVVPATTAIILQP